MIFSMTISNLSLELQNKIYSYVGDHPCAKMIKKQLHILTKYQICQGYVNLSIDQGLFIRHTRDFHSYTASFRKTRIVGRWGGILESINEKIFHHTLSTEKPIHIQKLLESLSYLRLNDIEKTWIMNRF